MNKTTFMISVFLLIVTSSNADYLYPTGNNSCISDLSPYHGFTGVCYTNTLTSVTTCDSLASHDDFIDGYNLSGSNCVEKNDLKLTGLSQSDWDYSLAFLAHLIGFTLLFLTNLTVIFVMKK